MATTVKTGWLHDKNGDKFAPKTLTSQVQTSDGTSLEEKIQADLDAAKEEILNNVSIDVDSALSSTSENPVQNKVIDAEFEAISVVTNTLAQNLSNKADKSHTHSISEVTDLQSNLDVITDTLDQKSQVQVVIEGNPEFLPTLMIHKLTQEEYNQEVANGTVNANAIYLTPEEEIDLSNYATIEQLAEKADTEHSHDDLYYTESEVDAALEGKSDTSHTHTVSNVTDLTATATELNYMSGVTSNVQTQLDDKATSSHAHTITANASDDDVVVLTGTNGTNGVTYSASHANSGVTAGTYKSVTVNEKGHVTGGSNPVTLAGYGITDAYTKEEIDTALKGKSDTSHSHDDRYYTESEVNQKIGVINNSISASTTEAKSYADIGDATTLETSKTYTDDAVTQKTQVQIITWEDDD